MENSLDQDIELQLQEELRRLKKAVDYIEEAKTHYIQSLRLFDDTQAKLVELSSLHDELKKSLQIGNFEFENRFAYQFNSIKKDIQKLVDNKTLPNEINSVKTDLSRCQKSIGVNISDLNTQIIHLTKKVRIIKNFNYFLLALLILTLFAFITQYKVIFSLLRHYV